ncbi:MAG: hypothetical protein ACREOZ_01320 [Gloeomargaritales cyanobacterium]
MHEPREPDDLFQKTWTVNIFLKRKTDAPARSCDARTRTRSAQMAGRAHASLEVHDSCTGE